MASYIGRRKFLATLGGAAAAWPFAARAQQQPERMQRIAWFGLGRADVPSPYLDALRTGLRDRGWIEGRNLTISMYWATGQQDMDAVARAMIASSPEVIVAQELTIWAVQSLNTAAPVVFGISGNPVDAKFVESFARPGGNLTGVSYLALDLVGKRIEVLKEWVPQVRHVAVLARPQHPGEHRERQATQEVIDKLEMRLSYFPTPDLTEMDETFRAVLQARCDALVVFPTRQCSQSVTESPDSLPRPGCPPSPVGVPLPETDCCSHTAQTCRRSIGRWHVTWTAFCVAPKLPSSRSSCQPGSSWSSISRQPRRSASKCRRRCSPAPTR
jgi:hypothetical protein